MTEINDPLAWVVRAEEDFAIRTCYPGNDPTAEDAKEAIELAKLVRNFARKFLGI